MKDFLGQTLEIGCNVVYHSQNYREFYKGIVVKFTPKNVLVKHNKSNTTILQSPQQLIRYEEQHFC